MRVQPDSHSTDFQVAQTSVCGFSSARPGCLLSQNCPALEFTLPRFACEALMETHRLKSVLLARPPNGGNTGSRSNRGCGASASSRLGFAHLQILDRWDCASRTGCLLLLHRGRIIAGASGRNDIARQTSWEAFMAAVKLSEKEVAVELRKLSGWRVVNGNLHRVFEFKDFSEAFGFMTRVAHRRRKNGSSSGLVQRLEQGHGGFVHAQRRRPDEK